MKHNGNLTMNKIKKRMNVQRQSNKLTIKVF